MKKSVALFIIITFIVSVIFTACSEKAIRNTSDSVDGFANSQGNVYDELNSKIDPSGSEFNTEYEYSYNAKDLPEIEIPEPHNLESFFKDFNYSYDQLMNNIELPDDFYSLSDTQKQSLVEKTEDLFKDLITTFSEVGLDVKINQSTGEIAMDATVLFGGDSAELTSEGKEFLNKFLKAYTSIIYNEKYDGFIAKTMVEGHIAPVSGTTYEGGMPLSEKRAENVKNYCLSSETGVDTSKLAPTLETVGYSQSRPVYDADGNVDIEASRRVSFRFIVNIDN